MISQFILAGIGTQVGKTVVASLLTEAFKADYWKPIQTGNLTETDTNKVKNLVSNTKSKFYPETFLLSQSISPFEAATHEGKKIQLKDLQLPETDNHLIVELAGGLMAPLNDRMTNMNLIQWLGLPVVVVSKHYPDSINHTLLSIQALQQQQVIIKGIIFNGHCNDIAEELILDYTGVRCLGRVAWEENWDKETVKAKGFMF